MRLRANLRRNKLLSLTRVFHCLTGCPRTREKLKIRSSVGITFQNHDIPCNRLNEAAPTSWGRYCIDNTKLFATLLRDGNTWKMYRIVRAGDLSRERFFIHSISARIKHYFLLCILYTRSRINFRPADPTVLVSE